MATGRGRARWTLAQLGSKPGQADQLGQLLTAAGLGDGWLQLDQRTWRTGSSSEAPYAVRAREAKSISAWRSFEQPTRSRWLWIQTVPLATSDDVAAAIADIPHRMLSNPGADVTVVGGEDVLLHTALVAGPVWAHCQETLGPSGPSQCLYFWWADQNILLIAACSSLRSDWSWDEVERLARLQSERLAQGRSG